MSRLKASGRGRLPRIPRCLQAAPLYHARGMNPTRDLGAERQPERNEADVEVVDVVIIGAGPAGSVAGTLFARRGRRVVALERQHFPRQVIGESLLPRCNEILQSLDMLPALEKRGYTIKRGATFWRDGHRQRFDFASGLAGDFDHTYQVPRDDFDQTLATEARRQGVDVRFGIEVRGVEVEGEEVTVTAWDLWRDRPVRVRGRYLLDCSGYGRVLPRLLGLESPTGMPERVACFTHFEGDRRPADGNEGDIWVCTHPDNGWLWMIPFSNGRTSVGAVCDPGYWDGHAESNLQDRLVAHLARDPAAHGRLAAARPVLPTQVIRGYSRQVTRLHGPRWVVTGNAGDFLDPVFSSGVCLAMESAHRAAGLADRVLDGAEVDWAEEYDLPMRNAVAVFRAFVEGWYAREIEQIFFAERQLEAVKRRITSILGGNVLRPDNPLVREPRVALRVLHAAVSAAGGGSTPAASP
jgi:flavin-dependent dehydrogenase